MISFPLNIPLYNNQIYKSIIILYKKSQKSSFPMALNYKESIFTDIDPFQQPPNSPLQIRYIQNTQSQDYISQFFCDDRSISSFKERHESEPLFSDGNEDFLESIQQHVENRENPEISNIQQKRKKSIFHNFQKHLVITLRKLVKFQHDPSQDIISQISVQMWEIFKKSHLYTKTILHIIYGADHDVQQCQFTSAMLNKFGFVDLFNKYTEQDIKQAQKYLRQETVKVLNRTNVKQYLNKRKMSRSEQFQEYLQQFKEQLQQGPIRKRIPKAKKKMLKSYQKQVAQNM